MEEQIQRDRLLIQSMHLHWTAIVVAAVILLAIAFVSKWYIGALIAVILASFLPVVQAALVGMVFAWVAWKSDEIRRNRGGG